jgi:hypothetical protein
MAYTPGGAGGERVVHHDAAALAHSDAGGARQLIARADASGHHHHVERQVGLAGGQPGDGRIAQHLARAAAHVHLNAQALDGALQQAAADGVDLAGHQARRQLDDVRLDAALLHRPGRLEAQQAAAQHGAALGFVGIGPDRVQIVEGPVHEHALALDAGDGRHERRGAGGQHQAVEDAALADAGDHLARREVHALDFHPGAQLDVVLLVPGARGQQQGLGAHQLEVLGELHAVVGGPRLLADHDDPCLIHGRQLTHFRAESLTDHAVSDD